VEAPEGSCEVLDSSRQQSVSVSKSLAAQTSKQSDGNSVLSKFLKHKQITSVNSLAKEFKRKVQPHTLSYCRKDNMKV
jgi:hypothetical protein